MSSPSLLAFALLAATAACPVIAQVQDQTMLDRVTAKPDMRLVNPMQEKKFESAPGLKLGKAHGLQREVRLNDYPLKPARPTRSFLGIRNPWLGSVLFPAGPAWLPGRSVPGAGESFPTASFRSRTYVEAQKSEPEVRRAVPVRPYLARGGAQGALDLISEAARRELTPDELRELLNKPR